MYTTTHYNIGGHFLEVSHRVGPIQRKGAFIAGDRNERSRTTSKVGFRTKTHPSQIQVTNRWVYEFHILRCTKSRKRMSEERSEVKNVQRRPDAIGSQICNWVEHQIQYSTRVTPIL